MRWGSLLVAALGTSVCLGASAALLSAQAAPEGDDKKAGGGTEAKAAAPATTGECVITGTIAFPAASKRRRRVRRRYPGQAPGAKKSKKSQWFPAVVFVENLTAKPVAKEVVATMNQEGIAFDPPVLPVQEGTTVTFPNLDPVYHNVLSYSSAKRFDLGRYPKGETRTVRFEQQGVVRLACEIHEHMKGYIVVLRHPHFTTTDAKGAFTLSGLPAGTHRLAVWHDKFAIDPVTVTVAAGTPATVTLTARAK